MVKANFSYGSTDGAQITQQAGSDSPAFGGAPTYLHSVHGGDEHVHSRTSKEYDGGEHPVVLLHNAYDPNQTYDPDFFADLEVRNCNS